MARWHRGVLSRLSSPGGDVHTPASHTAATASAATSSAATPSATTATAAAARPPRRLALLSSLRGYRRAWATPDLLAALTLLVIAVPEQLATSRLAGMPPITGFYAFVAGTVLFALLGSNPQMSVGADSTIAPLFAVGDRAPRAGRLAPLRRPGRRSSR